MKGVDTANRRKFTEAFKARVAKEALRGDKTVQQIVARYSLIPNHVSQWNRKAREGLLQLFEQGRKSVRDEREAEIRPAATVTNGSGFAKLV